MALTCLLDTSVWNRLDRAPALATEVTALLRHSEVGYSDIERLEVLRSARHIDHYRRLAMLAALPKVALTEAAIPRAGQVQEQLVQRSPTRREDPADRDRSRGSRLTGAAPGSRCGPLASLWGNGASSTSGWVVFTAALL